jgi:hypothetical protein
MLAANRDEVYARPFTPPRRWVAKTPFWAPRDEEEGGTWLGVNDGGLVAAITNRSRLPSEAGRASRGHLVVGALASAGIAEARAWLEDELASRPRNPFQLFVGQGGEAFLCRGGPEGVAFAPLARGLHVLSNLHDDGEIDLGLRPDATFEEIRPVLADTTPRLPRGHAVCKRAGWRGTVASAFLEPGRTFLFADGPPDEAPFEAVPGYGAVDSAQ